MTGDEHKENAIGLVNGLNLVFTVNLPYKPGTLFVLPNGQLRNTNDDDGWIESNPSIGEFQMKLAPRNDKIFVRYIEE